MAIYTTVSHNNLSFVSNLVRSSDREKHVFYLKIKEGHSAVLSPLDAKKVNANKTMKRPN